VQPVAGVLGLRGSLGHLRHQSESVEVLLSIGFNVLVIDANGSSPDIGWGFGECMNIVGVDGGLTIGRVP